MGADKELVDSFNSFIEKYGDVIRAAEEKQYTVDADMIKVIKFTAGELWKIVSGAKIDYYLQKPFKSMAYISIVGRDIVIKNPAVFAELSKFASNIEMYPRTDGNTQINFTYNEIGVIVKEKAND